VGISTIPPLHRVFAGADGAQAGARFFRHNAVARLRLVLVVGMFALNFWPQQRLTARICTPAQVDHAVIWHAPHLGWLFDGAMHWRTDVAGVPVDGPPVWSALQQLHGPGFWVRTKDYGYFDWPGDWQVEAVFWLLPGRQQVWFISAPSQPETVFVLFFSDDPWFARPDGSHYGIHPCINMRVMRAAADAVFSKGLSGGH
jgi:hypothetical protein